MAVRELGRAVDTASMLRRVSIVAVAMASLVGVLAAPAMGATAVERYTPFNADGSASSAIQITATRGGDCWTGSLAAQRSDAWRCMSRHLIYDPCFAASPDAITVLCPVHGPWDPRVLELDGVALDASVANRDRPSAWALQLTNGLRCGFLTGATSAIGNLRANFVCSPKVILWGEPNRRAGDWTILAGRISATKKRQLRRVTIAAAWL
jgi:hypothetical protein